MAKGDRKRKKDWSYHVVTHDWPVGVGTVSESLSREARYEALNSFFDSACAGARKDPVHAQPGDTALSPECVDTDS